MSACRQTTDLLVSSRAQSVAPADHKREKQPPVLQPDLQRFAEEPVGVKHLAVPAGSNHDAWLCDVISIPWGVILSCCWRWLCQQQPPVSASKSSCHHKMDHVTCSARLDVALLQDWVLVALWCSSTSCFTPPLDPACARGSPLHWFPSLPPPQ